jgi:hypothetical protein
LPNDLRQSKPTLGLVIVEAKTRFEHGQELHKQDSSEAMDEFDGA